MAEIKGPVCEKCKGTGKIEVAIARDYCREEDCDLCDGTGYLPVDYNTEIIKRLDTIIKLMKKEK